MIEIDDYNYITSSIGNAFFSGLSMEELWDCIVLSTTREELDIAVSSSILLTELIKKGTKYD